MTGNRNRTEDSKRNHYSPTERQEILEKLLEALREDQRVAGVLIVGSGSEGFEDIYSDIDLSIVIEHAQDVYPAFQEWGTKLKGLLPVFCCVESIRGPNVNLWVILLDNFLEIDACFHCLDDLTASKGCWKTAFDRSGKIEGIMQTSWANGSPPNFREVYDRRVSWVWYYAIHATIAAQRGQCWKALYELEQVRSAAIELRGLREGLETKRFRHVDQMPEEFLSGIGQTLAASLETPEIMRALRVATELFFYEAKRLDEMLKLDQAKRFEKKVLEYLELFQ